MRLVAQLVELKPNKEQVEVFYRHSEARCIARNDLIAEYKKHKICHSDSYSCQHLDSS